MKIPDAIMEAVIRALEGSSESPEAYLDRTGLPYDSESIVEQMLDANYEQCPNCETWVECNDLLAVDEDDPDGFCTHCR